MVGLLISVHPLRESRPFARLWSAGALVSISAQMMQMAIAWTVYTETNSSLAVGLLGLMIGLPTLIFGLIGGALTDARSPRTVGFVGVSGQLVATIALLVATVFLDFSLALVYACVFAQSSFGAVASPTRRPYIRFLLTEASIPAAMSLYILSMHMGQVLGPIFGGLILDRSTIAVILLAHAIALIPYLISVLLLPNLEPAAKQASGIPAIVEGLKVTWRLKEIRVALLIDLCATLFALPVALLPAYNEIMLGGNSVTYGWLLTALSIGGIVGTILSGWLAKLTRPVESVVLFSVAWCVVVGVLGLSHFLSLAIVALIVMGVLDVWSVIVQQTVVQATAPDAALGRVASIQGIVSMAGPQLGNFRAGIVGSLIGPQAAIMTGAIVGAIAIACSYATSNLKAVDRSGD